LLVMGSDPKVTSALAADVRRHPDSEPIDVVVELKPTPMPGSGSRGERIAQARSAFERQADAVRRLIVDVGGEVLASAWINQTLQTRLPKQALEQLAGDDRITRLDVNRVITAD
jgi:hypothetical protein